MTADVHIKRYADPSRCAAARAHLGWLRDLNSGVRLPAEHPGPPTRLVLERLPGRHAAPADLITVAETLGRLHGTAHAKELHTARLDGDHRTSDGMTIPSFHTGRQHILTYGGVSSDLPVAIYKDTNLRNVLISDPRPALLDFDDLTLAPFGYDLAKLVVSLAMTHGHLEPAHVAAATVTYTNAVQHAGGPAAACTTEDVYHYAEIHHRLTIRYLHRNGYRHAWPDIRPWAAPPPRPERTAS